MKERPILFSAPMVRALLAGTKTQTRRVMKPQPDLRIDWVRCDMNEVWRAGTERGEIPWFGAWCCPYGQPGDQLWVKETWRTTRGLDHCKPANLVEGAPIEYVADQWNPEFGLQDKGKKRVSLFMRRWMSRIQLEITGIRVERLNDISEADASAEGLSFDTDRIGYWSGTGDKWWNSAREAYADLWVSINGAGSWTVNPWVWVIEFRRIKP